MSVSSGDLPTIGKEFWDILHKGTGHLNPKPITIYGINHLLMGLSFLGAGKGIEGVEDVKASARSAIEYALIAGARDMINNAKIISGYQADGTQFLNSNSLFSLVHLANEMWYVNRTLENIPKGVRFIRSERSGLKGIITPVCNRLVEAFIKRNRKYYVPDDLFDGLANYQNLL